MPYPTRPTPAILRARLRLVAKWLTEAADLLPDDAPPAICESLSLYCNDAGEFVRGVNKAVLASYPTPVDWIDPLDV